MNPATRQNGLASRFGLFRRKDMAGGAEAALNVGWYPVGRRTAAADPRRLSSLLGTYGGTDDGVIWVYACTSLVMSEMASYPYEILTTGNRILPINSVPPELLDLLDRPNQDMTYFDMIEYKQMDEELAGNSYWLKNQIDGLGRPLELLRMRPEYVQIAVNDAGRIVGYIYNVPAPTGRSVPVPFDRNEVIHYKRPSPLSEYYGMGTVEAIQRSLNADLAQTDHVIGFFSDGAKISGVLTTTTLSEIQFQRFKDQFYEEFANDPNSHGILIAESGTQFDPITQAPGASGVVELRKMTKDEILSAFGIPAPLLGGVLDDANHKIEDSEQIFTRKMVPRGRRTSEKLTRDLVAAWRLVYRVNVTYAESKATKIEHATQMLKGGASVNESRHAMDLPPVAEDWANTPVIPQGFAPFGFMTSGGAPSRTPVAEGGNVQGNHPATTNGQPAKGLKGFNLADFEQINPVPKASDPDVAAAALAHHRDAVAFGYPVYVGAFSSFIRQQRARVMERVAAHGDDHNARRFTRSKDPILSKKQLTIGTVWSADIENDRLVDAYRDALATVAEHAMTTDAFSLRWDAESPTAREIVSRLSRGVADINETTRNKIAKMIAEGLRRNYSVTQIAHGYPSENYAGIIGVFDELSDSRVHTIARTETVTTVNLSILAGYADGGVLHVEVFDGTEDEACREANGSVWEISKGVRDPISHPNCVRAFAPVAGEEP